MQELRSALDEIEGWLRTHAPDLARSLRPGLTRVQMQSLIGARPLALPEEAVVLYERWDGMADRHAFFYDREFLPLLDALKYYDILADVDRQWGVYPFAWLPVFQVQYTRGAYAILCGPHSGPFPAAAIDDVGDGGGGPLSGSLTELLQFVAAQFRRGAYFVGPNGELELDDKRSLRPYGSPRPDRASCVELFATHPEGDLPLVVMRAAAQSQDARITAIIERQLRRGRGQAWRDPLLLDSFVQHMALKAHPTDSSLPANTLMVDLCRNPWLECRWMAMFFVGGTQSLRQFHITQNVADFLAEELKVTGRPPGYVHAVTMTFGKARDERAVPYLLGIVRTGDVNNAHVARLCLDDMGQPGTREFNRRFR